MGWPISRLPDAPNVGRPSPWFVGMSAASIALVGVLLVVISWPILHGNATGLAFWLCVGGGPFLACAAFLALVMQFHAMAVFRGRCWDLIRSRTGIAWQHWSRQHVVLTATSTLIPVSELAGKIAGLAGAAPQNKTEVLKLDGFGSDLYVSRTQRAFERLLAGLKQEIRDAAGGGTIQVMVWAGECAKADDVDKKARAAWQSQDLPPCAVFCTPSEVVSSSVGQYVLRRSTPLLVLCAQLHDDVDAHEAFSESAVALLFERPATRQRGNRPVVRLYRPMPASIVTMRTDLEQLGEMGPFRLGQIRTAWNGGLSKAESFAFGKAVADVGLVLGNGANGVSSLSDCIGPVGPVSPWLSLAIAAELVRYGQGPQLLAISQQQGIELAIAAADLPAPVSRPDHVAGPDLRAAGSLVCLAPWCAVVLGVLVKASDLFPWIVAGVVMAGVAAMLFMLAHPLLTRSLAARDVTAAGGRMPVHG